MDEKMTEIVEGLSENYWIEMESSGFSVAAEDFEDELDYQLSREDYEFANKLLNTP